MSRSDYERGQPSSHGGHVAALASIRETTLEAKRNDACGKSFRVIPLVRRSAEDVATRLFSTIYVSGLPRLMTTSQLADLCRVHGGHVVEAWIEQDPDSGAPWPFGYVEFASPEEAQDTADRLHGMRYRGDVLAARTIASAPPKARAVTPQTGRGGTEPTDAPSPRAARRARATEPGAKSG